MVFFPNGYMKKPQSIHENVPLCMHGKMFSNYILETFCDLSRTSLRLGSCITTGMTLSRPWDNLRLWLWLDGPLRGHDVDFSGSDDDAPPLRQSPHATAFICQTNIDQRKPHQQHWPSSRPEQKGKSVRYLFLRRGAVWRHSVTLV